MTAVTPPIQKAHQNLMFTTAPNLQRAVAAGLARDDVNFASLANTPLGRRDQLARPGWCRPPIGPANRRHRLHRHRFFPVGLRRGDVAFHRHITAKAGATAILVSAFYDAPDAPGRYARFAFWKREQALTEAIYRLKRHFGA